MRTLLLALLVTAIFCQPVFARPRSDLDMELVEGAKKEKKLVFYTTMDLPQSIEVVRDFAQKYPFLGLELHPLEAETLVKRIQDEARSGISTWDVLLGGSGFLQPLLEANLIVSYLSPQREAVSDALNDSAGYWSGYYINPYVLGYSTTLVKEEEIPKSYDELLEPRWKGNRIAIDSTAHGLLRGLVAAWGEDKAVAYLKRLAHQQPIMARASITAVDSLHTGNVSMVIARAPVIQGYKKKLRSPIDWIYLAPVVAQIDAVMLSAQSRSPNAARLFVDFVLSKEGQSVLASAQQIPVRRDMEPTSKPVVQGHPWFVERPDNYENFRKTVRLFREIFGIQ
ncbi:MAG TPA: extracellular solute-binding protein [Candidatus Binatia bacterium]|nr:extracellular solute-binding protein [Candidatus Binatia bacterium]